MSNHVGIYVLNIVVNPDPDRWIRNLLGYWVRVTPFSKLPSNLPSTLLKMGESNAILKISSNLPSTLLKMGESNAILKIA
jgi:hypothetical protein